MNSIKEKKKEGVVKMKKKNIVKERIQESFILIKKEKKERKKKLSWFVWKFFVDFIFVVQHCNIIFLMIICGGTWWETKKTTIICGSCVGAQKSRGWPRNFVLFIFISKIPTVCNMTTIWIFFFFLIFYGLVTPKV